MQSTRISVQRTSGMPYVNLWVDSEDPDEVIIHMDESLITEEGAKHLSNALTREALNWQRCTETNVRPPLRVHTS